MINYRELFLEGSKNMNIYESLGHKKGYGYINRARNIFRQIVEECTDSQVISGSYINLSKIEKMLNIEPNTSGNADLVISKDTFNKCMEYIDKAESYNKKNSNLIGYRAMTYLDRGMYNSVIQVLQNATFNDIYVFRSLQNLNYDLFIIKQQREDENGYINRDRIDFLERLYKLVIDMNPKTRQEVEIVSNVVGDIISILVIAHQELVNESPKRLIAFYKDVESRFNELLPIIIPIVGSSCISVDDMEYLEVFIKRCLTNRFCVNSSTRPAVIVGYKSYLHTALLAQGKYDECRKIDKESLKVIKNNTTLHNAGNTMFKMKKYEKAIKYLKQALFIYEDETTYKLLGDCYFEYNKFEEAIKYYVKSLAFINEKSSTFSKIDGEHLVRSVKLGNTSDMKVKLYEGIINCYINLRDYSTALAYNTIATNEFIHEDSFRMMNKMLDNFVDITNENKSKHEQLEIVEKELKKQQEFTRKALLKVNKWAEEIMNIQDIRVEELIDENEFEKLENRLLEIANNMKSETSLNSTTYTKLRRYLLNKYRGIERKSIDFLATGEFLYNANEAHMIDYAPIMLEFCKVIELELNAYIKKIFNIETYYTLGALNKSISKWGNKDLKENLDLITKYRNASAHSGMIDREKVTYVRKLFFEDGFLNELINIKKSKDLNFKLLD